MLPPTKIDFTAPVGPLKFLRARREELAAMRFVRIGVEQMGAPLGAEITGGDLRRLVPGGARGGRRAHHPRSGLVPRARPPPARPPAPSAHAPRRRALAGR